MLLNMWVFHIRNLFHSLLHCSMVLRHTSSFYLIHIVWKLLKMSYLNFGIFRQFCPIKTDLSGNTFWPQARAFNLLLKLASLVIKKVKLVKCPISGHILVTKQKIRLNNDFSPFCVTYHCTNYHWIKRKKIDFHTLFFWFLATSWCD